MALFHRVLALCALAVVSLGVGALPATASVQVPPDADIVYFWGDGCPNCAKVSEYLDQVREDYPQLVIADFEIWNNADNRDLFESMAAQLDFPAQSVPTLIIEERVWIGWTTAVERDLAAAIEMVAQGQSPTPGLYGSADAGTCSDVTGVCTSGEGATIDVPLWGDVGLADNSLLVSTLLIGFVDGINPCSLWVIAILLVIVIRTGSRRRVLAIGSTFLLVTAAMYGLYMAAMYSALAVVSYLGIIHMVVASVALIFGAVSIKDYFAFKKGLSFTIADDSKPGIFQRARAAAGHRSLIPALAATVGLAVMVSLVETPCTAGFPLLWTGMLHANDVGAAETAGLWVAYMIPFLLDELVIFAAAVITMRATRMQDKHGELLKLIAGVTMVMLAAVMFIDATAMEQPLVALGLFVAAGVLAGVIHAVTTQVKALKQARLEAESLADDAQVGG